MEFLHLSVYIKIITQAVAVAVVIEFCGMKNLFKPAPNEL